MSCGWKLCFQQLKALLILFKLIFIGQAYSVAILKVKKSKKKEKHYYEQATWYICSTKPWGWYRSLIF
jgi:hypothetical protein